MNNDPSAVEIDDHVLTSAGARGLSERTDLPVAGFPKVETRHLPFMERLRLRWLGQLRRDARR
jgi:hypothetical protein